MLRIAAGVFIVLHGLVHLWYFTLSQGLVEFQPEMGWTGRSWLLSPALGGDGARSLASILYIVATVAFVGAGVALLARSEWLRWLLPAAALLSSVLILLFWEGGLNMWAQKGLIGLLINVVLLVAFWVGGSAVFGS